MIDFQKSQVPVLRPGFRLQWEPIQNSHVLLYPEGMVKLNESAAQVLLLIDGERQIKGIIDSLSDRFPNVPGLDEDILAFIEVANAQHWIQVR
ncbi:pyrroloquinoline quinone biosynthesis peptide chaperone PqqD [Halopseudomonas salina]|uniref:PqqA binding protein n=1 Tax=Halopseudomonas salina TaxID=1323744 RepID=A0ABQ1PQZ9_9GAMM|nr:pyrroloquinoline quinone biosynthesis peptide chaperone PqqD [Halopseudomonas salina]GGD01289.1 coenzyme PQQ synthesis protein D [Halopseudomonas salina]